jgi:hypothetical protein
MAAPRSSSYRGWFNDAENSTLDLYVGYGGASDPAEIMQVSTTKVTLTSSASSGLTVTAGDLAMTAGNLRAGPINAFGTTEPTQAVILEAGTAPAGAITTSSGIFSSSTVLRKIIADGTVSNVQA